jgi:rhodanese-related sulfurtransferase
MKKKNNTLLLTSAIGVLLIIVALTLIPTSSIKKVSGQAFMQSFSITPGAVLLDVRTPAEFTAGHIAGASNIDFENQSFISEIKKLDLSKTYFVYCRSGNRSGQAVNLMKENGIKNIIDLQGGITGNKDIVLQY